MTALLFAAFFLAVSPATAWVQSVFGQPGIFALAGLVGASDIDPFVLGLAQGAAHWPIGGSRRSGDRRLRQKPGESRLCDRLPTSRDRGDADREKRRAADCRPEIYGGIEERRAGNLLRAFFRDRRRLGHAR